MTMATVDFDINEEVGEHWLVDRARKVLRDRDMKGVINCKRWIGEALEEIGENSPMVPGLKRVRRDINRWLDKENRLNAMGLLEWARKEIKSARENLERVQEGQKTASQVDGFFMQIRHDLSEAQRCLKTLREKPYYIPFVTEHEVEIAGREQEAALLWDESEQLQDRLFDEAEEREAERKRVEEERIRLELEARDREVSQKLDEAENALDQGTLGTVGVLLGQVKGLAVNELSDRRAQLADRLLKLSVQKAGELRRAADNAFGQGNPEDARHATELLAALLPEAMVQEFGSLEQAQMYIQRCRRRFADTRRKPVFVR